LAKIELYDTTLRDGAQSEDIAFTIDDKYLIATKLNQLGIDYIEAGWPGANPKDKRLFPRLRDLRLNYSKVIAFSSTCRPGNKPENDTMIKALLQAKPDGVTIFGKAWDVHVQGRGGLGCLPEENLHIIADTIAYLKQTFSIVFFDAEHFFDGFKANREYTLAVIKAAKSAGVDRIILCDTNGGSLPSDIAMVIKEVKKETDCLPLGIHCHNDGDLAVANTLCAVENNIDHVQGTINGIGERCGNANLCSVIPNLSLKMDCQTLPEDSIHLLTEVSRFVNDIANLSHNKNQPYVGEAAFAHKGGMHVSAVMDNPQTYEHIDPMLVGNKRRVLVSEQSGKSNIIYKAREFNLDLAKNNTTAQALVKIVKDLEDCGFQFEGADASLELLIKRSMGEHMRFFKLKGFRVITEKRSEDTEPVSEATIMIDVDGNVEHTAALGNGPVNALDNALRKALEKFYSRIEDVNLLDFKVRVISSKKGTESVVRVLIESGDKQNHWNTVGVSSNIIEASWMALVDSMDYKLYKDSQSFKE